MKLFFELFSKKSKGFYLTILLTGILNSIVNSAFLIIISKSIADKNFFIFHDYYPFLFLGLFVGCIGLNVIFYSYIIRISTSIICDVELNLLEAVKNSSFKSVTLLDKEEIFAAIRNLAILGDAPTRFINIFNSCLTIIGCLVYLYWSSWLYGSILSVMIVMLIATFLSRSRMRKEKYEKMRKLEIDYYKYLADLFLGFKDIHLSHTKSRRLFADYLSKNRHHTKGLDIQLKHNNSTSVMIANYGWYFVLGLVLFVLPRFVNHEVANISTFVLILVYVISPVSHVTSFFPFISGLKASSKALEAIYTKLSLFPNTDISYDQAIPLSSMNSISFNDVTFSYVDIKQNRTFTLGPLDTKLDAGQIIFITGGNGSGKSTFLNLLAGLQVPDSGGIFFNDSKLSSENYASYRNKLCAVFIEGYLMNENYEGFDLSEQNPRFMNYLSLMEMPKDIAPEHMFKSKNALSKGQQKRLSLIMALLTERQVLVLDEWAAEQDPKFKAYFYTSILPTLRDEGRTIIAITHDEQYFNCADRVITFRDGQILIEKERQFMTC